MKLENWPKCASFLPNLRDYLPRAMPDDRKLGSTVRKMKLFASAALFCVAVPGFSSVKAFIILVLWAYLLILGRFHIRSIIWFLSVLLNLAFWCEVALLHAVPTTDMLNQLSRLLLFFLVIGIGSSMVASGTIDSRSIDGLIVRISIVSAILKIGILAAVLSGRYTLNDIQSALGFETVAENIGLGLQRLQFPSDIILIFLIACYVGGRSKVVDLLLLLGVTISVFLSFSRYLFAAYVLCMILRTVRLRKLDTISRAGILVAGIFVSVFFVSLSTRFTGEGSSMSDDARIEQVRRLTDVISGHMVLGTGIGSSVNSYKRSDTIPFSYEVQWYALTMQFGGLGLLWLVANLICPLTIRLKTAKEGIFFFLVFIVWVLAGFTNPFVISLGSAFGFCILMLRIAKDSEIGVRDQRAIQPPRG
jgi:hypothetical protein